MSHGDRVLVLEGQVKLDLYMREVVGEGVEDGNLSIFGLASRLYTDLGKRFSDICTMRRVEVSANGPRHIVTERGVAKGLEATTGNGTMYGMDMRPDMRLE